MGSVAEHAVLRDVGPAGVLRAAGLSRAAEPSLSQQPRRHLLGRDAARPASPRSSGRPSACRPPTSTATAGSTSTWPTTARRTSSGSTGTTARSRTAGCCPAPRLGPFGEPKSGMGVDAGDIDDDGDEDLVVTNLTGEGHDLYVNDGTGHIRECGRGGRHQPPQPALHRVRRRLARRGQRRVAGPAHGERRGADPRLPCADGATGVARAAAAAVPQSRQRPIRGRHARRRPGAAARGRQPRRGLRRRGQRRRHRRRRGQQRWTGAAAAERHRPAAALGRPAAADSRRLRRARGARGRHQAGPAARDGGARAPTAATPRPTIRASSSDWATAPAPCASA